MAEFRSGCDFEQFRIYKDGVEITKDNGCKGEIHTFTTSHDLEEPVTYTWALDGISPPKPSLGSNSTYSYTFDDKTHLLYATV